MKKIEIRKCELKDLEQIFFLENSVFKHEGYNYLTLRQFYDVCHVLFKVAIIAESEVVGYTIAFPKVNTSDAWVLVLMVVPNYQRQGIGKELTSHILTELKEIGIQKVLLTVSPENKRAMNLYTSIGFEVLSNESNYFGEGSSRNIMQKVLLS
jgi:ribosomal-protein-alanine N-acetyltransferase